MTIGSVGINGKDAVSITQLPFTKNGYSFSQIPDVLVADGSHLSPSLSLSLCLQRELPCLKGSGGFGVCIKSLQLCLILCDPMGCSLPGSSVHGILQARTLDWVVLPFSRGSARPRDQTHISYVSCTGRWALPRHTTQLKSRPTRGNKVMAPLVQSKNSAVSIAPESL